MFESDPRKSLERFLKRQRGEQLDYWGLEKLRRYEGEEDDKYRSRLVDFHLSIHSKVKSGHLEVAPEHRPPFNFEKAEKFRKKMVIVLLVAFVMNVGIAAYAFTRLDFQGNEFIWIYMLVGVGGNVWCLYYFAISLKRRAVRMRDEQKAKALASSSGLSRDF